ncbi:hypothetical protein BX659_106114 [Orenia metallireducens]|jgi:hypothetical protein|uniref:Uncharacterized protein n=1 Tax=Orenia metallireducens TaxID=1413210 RepID=A0A285GZN1_9FIRM|nr:hypothetical protein [Orenia metallireducens]PRX31081.1 hypothetical protein BX659_106114 [Orenia metallireducens]SNY27701.1 hypothetical protein SAMN06265827_11172 [Orenia metallireducens]
MQGIDQRDKTRFFDSQLDQIKDIKILIHPEIVPKDDINGTVSLISRIYEEHDIKLAELLTSIEVHGLSLEDIVQIYSTLYQQIEGSEVVVIDREEDTSIYQ